MSAAAERLTAEPIALHSAIQSWNLAGGPGYAMPIRFRRYLADHGLITWYQCAWFATPKGERLGLR